MNGSRGRTLGAVAIALLSLMVVPAAGIPGAEPGEPDAPISSIPAPIIIDVADPESGEVEPNDPELIEEFEAIHESFEPGVTRSVATPVVSWPRAAAVDSGFAVTFDATHTAPGNVQSVIVAAAQAWDDVLATSSSGPVVIAVQWRDLGSPSLLGSAGPNGLYATASLPTSSFYAAGLANSLLGTDVNGLANAELVVNLNSSPNWYLGTTGSPGAGEIDLFSVVLHEIGHGLGFLGSASVGNDAGPSPTLDSPPFVFDEAVTHNGGPLLSASSPNSLLQSNNLYIDVSATTQEKLYAPASWQEGSSFSHFDESANPAGTSGALMTPSIGAQQTERTLDTSVLGVMAGMGWPMRVKAITPTITSVNPGLGQVSLSWSTGLSQTGLVPDGFRLEALRNGATVDATLTVDGTNTSATLTQLQSGAAYTVRVTPFAHNVDGAAASTSFTLSGAPGAPPIVTIGGGGLTQTVSWSPAAGSGITSYDVERSTEGVSWRGVGSTAGLSLVTTVTEGVHQFRVRAINGDGAGPYGYSIPQGISSGLVRPVALDGQVGRLYQAYFLRDPDAAGFGHWRSERAGGLPLNDISGAFAGSAEFVNTYGQLSDTQFVELVYQNVLGRSADGEGLAYWVGLLGAGTSRGEVMTGFSESAEYISITGTVAPATPAPPSDEVYRLYVAFFLRFPDSSGHAYWTGQRANGTSLETIAASFAASTEFVAAYGSLPDAQFVELVYNHVLGRSADASGAAYWLGQLAAGVDRGAMMVGFSESTEFIITTGTLP